MSDENKKLTVKEQKFVAAVVSGHADTAKDAVVLAGYNAKPANVQHMASQLLAKPHIGNALTRAIAEKFPDLPAKGAALLNQILEDPLAKYETKLKALDYMMKLYGWNAPTKHMSLHKDLDKMALPTGEED